MKSECLVICRGSRCGGTVMKKWVLSKNQVRIYGFCFFLVIFPILNVYKIILPLGDLIGILIMPFLWCTTSRVCAIQPNKKKYIYFLIYVFLVLPGIVLCLNNIDLKNVLSKSIHLFLYFTYFLFLTKKHFEIHVFEKCMVAAGKVLAVIAVMQQLFYRLFDAESYFLLPFMKLNYSIGNYNDYVTYYHRMAKHSGYRASAFFLEPAHFSMFMLLVLLSVLLKPEKRKKDFFWIFILIASIFSSYSTGGLIGLAVCILYYIFLYHGKGINKFFKASLIVIGICSVLAVIICDSQLVSYVTGRILDIGNTAYDTSGNRRILRGFLVWSRLPILNKIFGTGIGELQQFIVEHKIMVLTDKSYSDEMNTIACLLCSYGIIGTFIYFRSILSNIKKGTVLQRGVVLLFCVYGLYTNFLYSAISVLYLIYIFTGNGEKNAVKG